MGGVQSPGEPAAMRVLTLILILASIFCLIEGEKASKKQKKNVKMFKQLKKRAKAMEKTLSSLNETLIAANKTASVSTRHTQGTSDLTLVDATFTSTQCGAFTLTSWSTTLNCYHATGVCTTPTSTPFSGGTFTAVLAGWYHVCSFSRFRNTGNSNDVTVLVNGAISAAYGNADSRDWRSTGVCFDVELAAGNTVQVRQQSGGSNDCIQYGSWPYNKFTVHNTGNNG